MQSLRKKVSSFAYINIKLMSCSLWMRVYEVIVLLLSEIETKSLVYDFVDIPQMHGILAQYFKDNDTINVVIFAVGKFRENVGKTFHVGVIFTILPAPISFIKAYWFYFHVRVIFAKKTKTRK